LPLFFQLCGIFVWGTFPFGLNFFDMQRSVKQVIVMRRDLNMRKGKLVAQGAHASVGAFLQLFGISQAANGNVHLELEYGPDSFLEQWMDGSFAKICLYVDSKEELIALYRKVKEGSPDIPVELIEDAGLTEFHGVPTLTCLAIGPYWADQIDPYTGALKLF
jgi:PTH2 family peptidyl-tRNA hydrolase